MNVETTSRTEELRRLAEKASRGPWSLGRAQDGETYDGEWWQQVWPKSGAPIANLNGRPGAKHKDAADAAYIAALDPQTVTALLDVVDAARAYFAGSEEEWAAAKEAHETDDDLDPEWRASRDKVRAALERLDSR